MKISEIDCLFENFAFSLTENHIPYLQAKHESDFPAETKWRRIQLFEFSVGLQQGQRDVHETIIATKRLLSNKWSYWEDCTASLKLGKTANKQNSNACSYQKNSLRTASAIDGITITVNGLCHLPEHLESNISQLLSEFSIECSDSILAVGCNESCSHKPGVHFFFEVADNTKKIDTHSDIDCWFINRPCIHTRNCFLDQRSYSIFSRNIETYPRFLIRDAFIIRQFKDSIDFIYRVCTYDEEDDTEEDYNADEIQSCENASMSTRTG